MDDSHWLLAINGHPSQSAVIAGKAQWRHRISAPTPKLATLRFQPFGCRFAPLEIAYKLLVIVVDILPISNFSEGLQRSPRKGWAVAAHRAIWSLSRPMSRPVNRVNWSPWTTHRWELEAARKKVELIEFIIRQKVHWVRTMILFLNL